DNMLEIAKRKASEAGLDIEFHKMDIYNLNFPDNYFDSVFSMAAFEFVHEPEKALKELFRVVKKGGQVLVGTISRDSNWGRLYLSPEFQENTVFKYASFITLEELKSLEAEKVVSYGECLFIPPEAPEEDFNSENE